MHAPDNSPKMLSIWFLVGLILLIYGLILTACGIYYGAHPEAAAHVVLADLNPSLWWGGGMSVMGAIFVIFGR